MALVRVEKDKFNLRSKLNELDYGQVPYEKMPAGSIIQAASTTITTSLILSAATDSNLLFFVHFEAGLIFSFALV